VDYLAVQALLLLPPFVWILVRHRRELVRHWLFPFASFPFLFFFVSSLRAKVEANWVIMAYPAAYMLSVQLAATKELRWIRQSVALWAGATTLLVGVILLKPQLLARTRLYEAEPLRKVAQALSKPMDFPLYAFNYQSSSVLSFHLGTLVCKRLGLSRRDHFDYMPACQKEMPEFYLLVEKHVDTRDISSLESHQVLERQSLTEKFDLVRLRQ
jgi:hypothetical protein